MEVIQHAALICCPDASVPFNGMSRGTACTSLNHNWAIPNHLNAGRSRLELYWNSSKCSVWSNQDINNSWEGKSGWKWIITKRHDAPDALMMLWSEVWRCFWRKITGLIWIFRYVDLTHPSSDYNRSVKLYFKLKTGLKVAICWLKLLFVKMWSSYGKYDRLKIIKKLLQYEDKLEIKSVFIYRQDFLSNLESIDLLYFYKVLQGYCN